MAMRLPRITIVTPSYNQGEYLEATIRSVVSQEYPDLEYIVMDGGSTDRSVDIIRRYETKLACWRSEPDGGQAAAVATGFQRATGEILSWLNSDDLLFPGCAQRVGRYFATHPGCEVLSAGALVIGADGHPVHRPRCNYTLGLRATHDRLRFFGQDGVFQCATFFRGDSYRAVGGIDPRLRYIMDLDLFTRLAARGRFERLPEILACFRMHPESKTSNLAQIEKAELAAFRKRYAADGHRFGTARRGYYYVANRFRRILLFARLRLGLTRLPHA